MTPPGRPAGGLPDATPRGAQAAPAREDGAGSFTVRIEPRQWTFDAAPGQSLFEAARQAGIRLPALCRNGTCRTCFCKMTSGSVSYRIEHPGLSSDEKREGYILPCVAMAQSPLVLDLPEATLWSDPY